MAEWVAGIGSLLAAIVALAGYWLAERQRAREEAQRRQDAAYQIGYKLASLASEARNIKGDLNPQGKTDEELAAETDAMEICGNLQPKIGFNDTMAKDLSESEQNLLMCLKEESFLMTFSEAIARNQSIRAGLIEYKVKREAIMAMLPPPKIINGAVASHFLSQEELMKIHPHLIATGTLVQSLRALSHINVEQLAYLCREFCPMMKKHYPKLNVHKIELDA